MSGDKQNQNPWPIRILIGSVGLFTAAAIAYTTM